MASYDIALAHSSVTYGTPLRVFVAEMVPAYFAYKRVLMTAPGAARFATGAGAPPADALPTTEALHHVLTANIMTATLAGTSAIVAERVLADATQTKLRAAADQMPAVCPLPPVV
jgi:hypothetical protein